jgi:hypothetical protein
LDHDPFEVVNVCPTTRLPPIVGAAVHTGGRVGFVPGVAEVVPTGAFVPNTWVAPPELPVAERTTPLT